MAAHQTDRPCTAAPPVTILVTGVTGFLGKVVLEELIRRKNEGSVTYDQLLVLIRPARGKSPAERFAEKVASSRCFSKLPKDWQNDVQVIPGDLMEHQCGISDDRLPELTARITHIIHCAGCVAFDSAFNVLLAENVTGSLTILELAQSCPNLKHVVLTSTAYVTPHTKEPIWERLVDLPRPAQELLDDLHNGRKDPDQIRAETGHPNNYTLAKCLAEHFVAEKMGDVPVTILRPSIISASWQYPFPGWIDSFAALAGPIAAFGLGGLKVLHGDPEAVLDVVPVDEVAKCLIIEALLPATYGSVDLRHFNEKTRIVHCVSTTNNGISTNDIANGTVNYFEQPENIIISKPKGYYIGLDDRWFYFYEFFFQYLPLKLVELRALMMLDWEGAAKARKTLVRLGQVDTHFRYFVEHTYDYRSAVPALGTGFDKKEYFQIVLQGIKTNLLVPMMERQKAKAHKNQASLEDVAVKVEPPAPAL